jgi:hypothetical protein
MAARGQRTAMRENGVGYRLRRIGHSASSVTLMVASYLPPRKNRTLPLSDSRSALPARLGKRHGQQRFLRLAEEHEFEPVPGPFANAQHAERRPEGLAVVRHRHHAELVGLDRVAVHDGRELAQPEVRHRNRLLPGGPDDVGRELGLRQDQEAVLPIVPRQTTLEVGVDGQRQIGGGRPLERGHDGDLEGLLARQDVLGGGGKEGSGQQGGGGECGTDRGLVHG